MVNDPVVDDPIRIGDPAPDFRLPAVNRDGDIGLGDYTGRQAVLLGLFRGLHCPFCRRQVLQLNGYHERLAEHGVAALAVMNTELNRARMYFGRLRIGMALAVDPRWDTHRRYGLGRTKITLGKTDWPRKVNPRDLLTLRIDPTGELPEPLPVVKASRELNRMDGFRRTFVDRKFEMLHGMTGTGYTLIDKDGIVRWRCLEAPSAMEDMGRFPSADDVLAAVSRAQA